MSFLKTPVQLKGFDTSNYPYFFKNELISKGKQTFIVQKANTISQALAICDVWKRKNFNVTDSTENTLCDVPYIKYLYNGSNNIEKIKVIPQDWEEEREYDGEFFHNRDYEILLYKNDDKIYIVSLLPYHEK
jgi:hypothetical protein